MSGWKPLQTLGESAGLIADFATGGSITPVMAALIGAGGGALTGGGLKGAAMGAAMGAGGNLLGAGETAADAGPLSAANLGGTLASYGPKALAAWKEEDP